MEKRDLLKLQTNSMSLINIESVDQLLRGFGTTSFQIRDLAKSRTVPHTMLRDEVTTICLGIAGIVISEALTTDPKWGGLSGCTCKKAQSRGGLAEDAQLSAVYRQRFGLPLTVDAF